VVAGKDEEVAAEKGWSTSSSSSSSSSSDEYERGVSFSIIERVAGGGLLVVRVRQ
jgi:hypothetical protein